MDAILIWGDLFETNATKQYIIFCKRGPYDLSVEDSIIYYLSAGSFIMCYAQ
mgnify:CR=1 FL=1